MTPYQLSYIKHQIAHRLGAAVTVTADRHGWIRWESESRVGYAKIHITTKAGMVDNGPGGVVVEMEV